MITAGDLSSTQRQRRHRHPRDPGVAARSGRRRDVAAAGLRPGTLLAPVRPDHHAAAGTRAGAGPGLVKPSVLPASGLVPGDHVLVVATPGDQGQAGSSVGSSALTAPVPGVVEAVNDVPDSDGLDVVDLLVSDASRCRGGGAGVHRPVRAHRDEAGVLSGRALRAGVRGRLARRDDRGHRAGADLAVPGRSWPNATRAAATSWRACWPGHVPAGRGLMEHAIEAGRRQPVRCCRLTAQLVPLDDEPNADAAARPDRSAAGRRAGHGVARGRGTLTAQAADVIADCGRLDAGPGQPFAVLSAARTVAIVLRPTLRQVWLARPRIEMLAQLTGRTGSRLGLLYRAGHALGARGRARAEPARRGRAA